MDSAFEIDEYGRIYTTQELDFEIKSEYFLKVIASNVHENWPSVPETQVEIHVLNINDNAPMFPPLQRHVFPEGIFIFTAKM